MFSLYTFQDALVCRIKETNAKKKIKKIVGVWCPHFTELKITWNGCRALPHKISVPVKVFYHEKLKASELCGVLKRLEGELTAEYKELWSQKSAH